MIHLRNPFRSISPLYSRRKSHFLKCSTANTPLPRTIMIGMSEVINIFIFRTSSLFKKNCDSMHTFQRANPLLFQPLRILPFPTHLDRDIHWIHSYYTCLIKYSITIYLCMYICMYVLKSWLFWGQGSSGVGPIFKSFRSNFLSQLVEWHYRRCNSFFSTKNWSQTMRIKNK